jgi:hypothetical protein
VACPCLHLAFPDLVEDVGGLCSPPKLPLLSCDGTFPHYIPQVDHGSSRAATLNEQVVVVPLTALIQKDRWGRLRLRYTSPETLRQGMQLSRGTGVLLSSIAPDQPLEDFWTQHQQRELLPQLAALDLLGMTTPNFSFMRDVPRTNALYNLTRIFRMAERITKAGIPTILHLQANSMYDWARWAEVLKVQPNVRLVALEFQTGASQHAVGSRYYFGLVGLQQELGRPLHPVLFAAGGRINELGKDFESFSLVDSTPFLKTVHRQFLVQLPNNRWIWRPQPSKPGEPLHALLASNIANHRARMLQRTTLSAADAEQQHASLPPALKFTTRSQTVGNRFALTSIS